MLSSSLEAPITATLSGERIDRTAFAAAVASRSSKCTAASSVGAVAISTETAPGFAWIEMGNPLCRNTWIILWFSGSTFASRIDDPRVEGGRDQVSDQQRAQSRPLELIRHAHAQLGSGGVLADVLSPSDDRAAILPREGQEREVVRSVTVHRLRRDFRHIDRRRPEPEAPGLVRQPDQVVLDLGLILCPRRSKVNGSAVTENDFPLELLRRRRVHTRQP